MSKVQIVTDSTAQFLDPDFPQAHGVTVIPLTIQLGSSRFQEGVDLPPEEFFRRATRGDSRPLPKAIAPTPEQFAAVYSSLCETASQIISIHVSSQLNDAVRSATLGASNVLGRCQIQIIDSLSISAGLGLLVETAVGAAERGQSAEEIVRLVRRAIPHVYAAFITDTFEFLAAAGRMGRSHATLGAMLNLKVCLTFDEGDLIAVEKARSAAKAVERLVEFAAEFAEVEQAVILQSLPQPGAEVRLLVERLVVETHRSNWLTITYSPSLSTLLGPAALGVFILEGEAEPE